MAPVTAGVFFLCALSNLASHLESPDIRSMRHSEKIFIHDPRHGTDRVVNVALEIDLQALAQRAFQSMGNKLELADGLLKVTAKPLKR